MRRGVALIAILVACTIGAEASTQQELETQILSGNWQYVHDHIDLQNAGPVGTFLYLCSCEVLGLACGPTNLLDAPAEDSSGLEKLAWAEEFARAHSDNGNAVYVQGMALSIVGHNLEAKESLTEAIRQLAPLAPAYAQRSIVHSQMGDLQGALDDIERALSLEPKRARYYSSRATLLSYLGQNIRALDNVDTDISLSPDDAGLYYNRGNTYRRLKQNTKALADFTRTISLDSNLAAAYLNRANTLLDLGRTSEASSDYERFILIAPAQLAKQKINAHMALESIRNMTAGVPEDDPELASLMQHGVASEDKGDFSDAVKSYMAAMKLDSTCWRCICILAELYGKMGFPDSGIACCDVAIQRDSSRGELFAIRGFLRFVGNKEETKISEPNTVRDSIRDVKLFAAVRDFTKSLELQPALVLSYLNRAFAYERLHMREEAIRDYKTFIDLAGPSRAEEVKMARCQLRELQPGIIPVR